MARWLIVAGAALLLLGIAWHYFPGLLSWFGRLPGDIRIESERSRVFIPITSMVDSQPGPDRADQPAAPLRALQVEYGAPHWRGSGLASG